MADADDLLPAAPVLLGPEAREVLGAAVAFAGGRLHSVKSTQVQYRPGRSLAVLYDARITWPGKKAKSEGLVAMTSVDGPPAGSLPLEADGLSIGVWRLAHDPLLPGLRVALSKEASRRYLEQSGGAVGVSLRAYRPTRRGVVHLKGERDRYVKVVRPGRAQRLVDLHAQFGAVAPVPAVVSHDDELGAVCFEALPGRPLVDAIADEGAPLPGGDEVLDLLGRVATLPRSGRRKKSAREDAPFHARLLTTVLPDVADRVESVLGALGDEPDVDGQTIHGDFYEGQLLVDGDGRVSGVLDLDRAGTGHPADDLATMLAHLDALALYRPRLAGRALGYRDQLWRDFTGVTDEDDLRRRVAAVGLGLATGPYRLRHPQWRTETVRYLEAVVEGPLTRKEPV